MSDRAAERKSSRAEEQQSGRAAELRKLGIRNEE